MTKLYKVDMNQRAEAAKGVDGVTPDINVVEQNNVATPETTPSTMNEGAYDPRTGEPLNQVDPLDIPSEEAPAANKPSEMTNKSTMALNGGDQTAVRDAAAVLQDKLNFKLPEGPEADAFIEGLNNQPATKKNAELEEGRQAGNDLTSGLIHAPGDVLASGVDIIQHMGGVKAASIILDTIDSARDGMRYIMDKAGLPDCALQIIDEEGNLSLKYLGPEETKDIAEQRVGGRTTEDINKAFDNIEGALTADAQKTPAGRAVRSLTAFGIEMYLGGRLIKGAAGAAKATSAGAKVAKAVGNTTQKISSSGKAGSVSMFLSEKAIEGAGAGAFADFMYTDKDNVRISVLLNEIPILEPVVSDYLADNNSGNESWHEMKLKATIEGLGIGAVANIGLAGVGALAKSTLGVLKKAKKAGMAKLTDNYATSKTAEELLADQATNAVIKEKAVVDMVHPMEVSSGETHLSNAITEMDEGLIKSVDEVEDVTKAIEGDPAVAKAVDESKPLANDNVSKDGVVKGEINEPIEIIEPTGKSKVVDVRDSVAVKAGIVDTIETPAPVTLKEVVNVERGRIKKDLMKKGMTASEVDAVGDLSQKAGIKTGKGEKVVESVKPVAEVKAAPVVADFNELIMTNKDGAIYLNTAKLDSNEGLKKLVEDMGEKARMKVSVKGTTHEQVKAASKAQMADLNTYLGRDVTKPMTNVEAATSKKILIACDNSVTALSRSHLKANTKESAYEFARSMAIKSDLEEVILRGREANGQGLEAWKIDVGRPVNLSDDITPRLVTNTKGEVVTGARIINSKTGETVDDMSKAILKKTKKGVVDNFAEGKIGKGFKVVDAEGNIIKDADNIIVDEATLAKVDTEAKIISDKAAMKRSEQISEVMSGKGRDLRTKAILIDDIARKNPDQVSKVITQVAKLSKIDYAYKVWINGLLSSPATHAANFVSNSSTILMGIPKEYATQGWKLLFDPKNAHLATANANMAASFQGISDGWKLMTGITKDAALTSGGSKLEALGRGAVQYGEPAKTLAGRMAQGLGKAIDKGVIEAPGWALQKSDTFFKGINNRVYLQKSATDIAMQNGLKGDEYTAFIKEFVSNPPAKYVEGGVAQARKQTFTNDVGRGGKAFMKLQQLPGGRWVMPFVKTPANILSYGLEHVPIANLMFKSERAALMGGGEAAAEVMGRLTMGAGIMGTVFVGTKAGNITGSGPANYKERKALELTGWRPYSVKLGDTYYSYARFEPIASLMGYAADLAQIDNALHDLDESGDTMGEAIGAALAGTARQFTEKTFVQGGVRLMKIITSGNAKEWAAYVRDFADTAVPLSGARRSLGNYIDPVRRKGDPDTVYNELGAYMNRLKISVGMGEDMPPKRDVWGNPRMFKETLGLPNFISPIEASVSNNDPVNKMIAESGMVLTTVPKQIQGIKLSNVQQSEFEELAGKEAKSILDDTYSTFKDDEFLGTDSRFQLYVGDVLRASRQKAADSILRSYPELKLKIRQREKEKAKAGSGSTDVQASGAQVRMEGKNNESAFTQSNPFSAVKKSKSSTTARGYANGPNIKDGKVVK